MIGCKILGITQSLSKFHGCCGQSMLINPLLFTVRIEVELVPFQRIFKFLATLLHWFLQSTEPVNSCMNPFLTKNQFSVNIEQVTLGSS